MGASDDAVGLLPVPTRGCGLLALEFPVTSVASQSVNLELLEHLGAIQPQELVLDVLSKSLIELTIKCCIIPPCVGHMFRELNHVLVDMLAVVHLECMQHVFRGLGQIGLPEVNVQLVDKLNPITPNRWFGVCDQSGFPPEHGDVGEVRGSE